MKFRGTLIFALVVFVIVGYSVYDFKQSKKDEEAQSESEKILPFSPDKVTSFSLKRDDGEIVLEKREGKWQLVKPIEDLADESNVSTFLSAISSEKGRLLGPKEGEAIKWSDYSLEPVGAEILVLREGQAEPEKVSISKLAAFDGSYFVRRGESLILGTSAWAGHADKEAGYFRTKEIFRSQDAIESFTLSPRDAKSLVLSRKDESSPWTLKGVNWSVDQARVDSWVNTLKELRATGYLPENNDPASLKKYNLHRPHLSIELMLKGDGQAQSSSRWKIQLTGDQDGEAFAATSDSSGLFRLSGGSLGQLRLKLDDLRDRREPFRVAVEEIREIIVSDEKDVLTIRKEGSEWKPEKVVEGKAFNVGGVTLLLQKIEGLKADEFLSTRTVKPSGSGLRRMELKGADNKPLLTLELGEEYTSSEGERKGNRYVKVKSSQGGQVVGVPPTQISELQMSMFFNDAKTEEKSEN